MSNREEVVKIIEAAREHSERLTADIPLARVRDEHVRVTARANEAVLLLTALEEIFTTTVGAASDE
jgi:hypothetical protein